MPPNRAQGAQGRTMSMDDFTPSFTQHDSTSTPVSTTTQATRPLRASISSVSTDNSNTPRTTSPGVTSRKKRQRGPRVCTPHACTECRQKRAKCDGEQPCRRCIAQDVECYYKIITPQSKMSLRMTIEQLRHQQALNELVLNTLAHSRKWREVLCHLRSGRSVEAIANWLLRGGQRPSGAGSVPPLSNPSAVDTDLTSPALFSGVSDTSYTSGGTTDEPLSASSVSSDSLLGSSSRFSLDANSQWSQYSDANQAQSNASNSQSATHTSHSFTPNTDTNDLVAFWANSVPLPVAPWPATSGVASSQNSAGNSLLWPFPTQGRATLPTGDAFVDAGFGIM